MMSDTADRPLQFRLIKNDSHVGDIFLYEKPGRVWEYHVFSWRGSPFGGGEITLERHPQVDLEAAVKAIREDLRRQDNHRALSVLGHGGGWRNRVSIGDTTTVFIKENCNAG